MDNSPGRHANQAEAVVTTNRNFRIMNWDNVAQRLYGWKSCQVIGRNLDELLCTDYTGSSFQGVFSALLSSGRLEMEVRHTTRDGSVLTVLGNLELRRDSGGQITGIVHTYRSIAGHQQREAGPEGTERELLKKKRQLLDILDGSAEDLWIYDIMSNTEWHSAEWVKRRDQCGSFAAGSEKKNGTVHPDDCEQVDQIIKTAIADKRETFRLQCRTYARDEEYVWSQIQGRIQYDSSGQPVRISGMTIDISEMKNLEMQLQQHSRSLEQQTLDLMEKNKLMTDFFTNVSHEFKTPLSIILVDLQLMEYRLRDTTGDTKEKLGKTVSVMRQNALRLLRLIGNLLDVTKTDAGFMKTRLVNLDIVELSAGLTESVREYARHTGIDVNFESDCDSRFMPMDGEKIERIMLNLLSNAIKHTPAGGHITVRLAGAPDHITILVKDDGEGIPEDKKEFIFDRFKQANTSLARAREGCGIGLSLTRALVELLNGKIWFKSTPGSGSEFFVELPVLQADLQAPALEIEGMTRDSKVEMEFSDISKLNR